MMGDAALVLRARGGDEAAFTELCGRFHDAIRLKAHSYFLPDGDGADLIQEGRIGLLKAVRDYRPDCGSGFRNFAEICIYRQIITAVKTATREKHRPLNDHVSLSARPPQARDDSEATLAEVLPGPWHQDPVERLGIEEDLAAFTSCLTSGCSELEREVAIGLSDDLSYEEIAERLNVTVKAVDNAVQRVRRKLGAALKVAA